MERDKKAGSEGRFLASFENLLISDFYHSEIYINFTDIKGGKMAVFERSPRMEWYPKLCLPLWVRIPLPPQTKRLWAITHTQRKHIMPMTATTLQPVQKKIPFANYILPVILSKKDCCNLLGVSPRTLLRRHINEAFFCEIGEPWEDVKNLSLLSPRATEHFFFKYPQTKSAYIVPFIKEHLDNRPLVNLVMDRPLIPY